jgi:hypothetical protein
MVIVVLALVILVAVVFVYGRARSGGEPGPEELDPRTSRRQMDRQFKKPPNEGGLL